MIKWGFFILSGALAFTSCSPTLHIRKNLADSELKFKDHIGFVLYDPGTKKTLIDFNAGKYFTPASNTKIFTFYAALQILGDSVPGLKYVVQNDSLLFWGTGDPSFLYKELYENSRVYQLLSNATQTLFFSPANFQAKHFGPGWAWDDYPYAYSAERSSFPVFGNVMTIEKQNDKFLVNPAMFARGLMKGDSNANQLKVVRDINSNQTTFSPGKMSSSRRTWKTPIHITPEVIISMLSDTLKRKVGLIQYPIPKQYLTLKSVPVDTLFKKMMQDSDNFIAEQLLLLCADAVSDTLDSEIAIRYARKNFLFDLPDDPIWVDGSGLSRYNLFTPRSIVRLWEKIYTKVPRERLFKLLAVGSQSGTLKNWYQGDKPYIFGKTGSLSNNHTLSGFLITNKGKVLIFSFMNSDFIAASDDVRKMMQEVLTTVRNEY